MSQNRPTQSDLYTPANAVTLIGTVVTLAGALRLNTVSGLVFVIAGRLCDVIDGPLARRTHTSHFGAVLDATADKITGLALLIAAYHFKLAPLAFILGVFVYHLIVTIISGLTEGNHTPTQVSKAGKKAMFLQVGAIIWFVWASHVSHLPHTILYDLALLFALPSIWFAVQNIYGCAQAYHASGAKTHK